MGHRGFLLAMALPAFLLGAGAVPAWAEPGDRHTTLSYGVANFTVEDDSVSGPVIGLGWALQLTTDLEWNISAAQGDAEGQGATGPLSAKWVQVHTGLTKLYPFQASDSVIPFAGGGFSLLAYNVDFSDASLGETSGTGYGALVRLGLEIRLGRGFAVLPRYQVSVHSVTTAAGNSVSVLSDAMWVSFRIVTGTPPKPTPAPPTTAAAF